MSRARPASGPPAHRTDIQGLRALAVLVVALGHAGVPGFRGGFVGVDVFFVVSGFLITGILLAEARRTGSISLVAFYVRRARRIRPAAALTLIAVDLVASVALNFVRARAAETDSIWAGLFAANFHFAAAETDYFARSQPPSPVLHYWVTRGRGAVLPRLAGAPRDPHGVRASGPARTAVRRARALGCLARVGGSPDGHVADGGVLLAARARLGARPRSGPRVSRHAARAHDRTASRRARVDGDRARPRLCSCVLARDAVSGVRGAPPDGGDGARARGGGRRGANAALGVARARRRAAPVRR